MFSRFPFRVTNHWAAGFRAGLEIAALIDVALVLFVLALVMR